MTTLTRRTKDKRIPDLKRELDAIFSEFIRLRDMATDGKVYCFICVERMTWRQSECGHYIQRGELATRYDEENCHAICEECNNYDPRHQEHYALALEEWHPGITEVLATRSKSFLKLMKHEYQEMIVDYTEKVKVLKKREAMNITETIERLKAEAEQCKKDKEQAHRRMVEIKRQIGKLETLAKKTAAVIGEID